MAPVEAESALETPAADSDDVEDGWDQEKKRYPWSTVEQTKIKFK